MEQPRKSILNEVSFHIVTEAGLFTENFTLNFCEVVSELAVLTNLFCIEQIVHSVHHNHAMCCQCSSKIINMLMKVVNIHSFGLEIQLLYFF